MFWSFVSTGGLLVSGGRVERVGGEWAGSWLGSAESCLRSLRRLWMGAFALCAMVGVFASKARFGPVPLPLGFNRGL